MVWLVMIALRLFKLGKNGAVQSAALNLRGKVIINFVKQSGLQRYFYIQPYIPVAPVHGGMRVNVYVVIDSITCADSQVHKFCFNCNTACGFNIGYSGYS